MPKMKSLSMKITKFKLLAEETLFQYENGINGLKEIPIQ